MKTLKSYWFALRGRPLWQQIALGVVVVAVLLLILTGGEDAPEVSGNTIKIRVENRVAEPHQRLVVIYGASQPSRDVNLNAQIAGQVMRIPAAEGSLLTQGEVIMEIDPRDRPERLAQAEAVLAQRQLEFRAAQKLEKRGFQSEISLAQARARLEEARAALKQIRLELDWAQLTAPFDGLLEAVNVEIGDFVGIGTFGLEGPAARMVDLDPLLVAGRLSEAERPHVRLGMPARARLAGGQMVEGEISYLGTVADPDSRTFAVELSISNDDFTLPAGVTAELMIPAEEVPAHRVSSSSLALNDAGQVGVKYLDEDNRVVFAKADIIEETPEGLWLKGLPETLRLITLGGAYVSAGQDIPAEAVVEE